MSLGKHWLWMVLLLTVVAALWPMGDKDPAEDMTARTSAVGGKSAALNPAPAQRFGSLTPPSPAREGEIVDLFPRQSWSAPAASAAAATPTVPALPFTYGGRYTEGNNTVVFLIEGAKMHRVRLGDTINATYRIEGIASAAITLIYLPLGMQQTLQTGSTTSP